MEQQSVSAAIGYAYTPYYDGSFAEMQATADQRMYMDKDKFYHESGKKRR